MSDSVLHRVGLSDEVYYNAATILRQKLLHNFHSDLKGGPAPTHWERVACLERRPLLRRLTFLRHVLIPSSLPCCSLSDAASRLSFRRSLLAHLHAHKARSAAAH